MRKNKKFNWIFYDPLEKTDGFTAFLDGETSPELIRNRGERHQLKFRRYNGKTYIIKRFSPSDNKRLGHRIDLALKSLFSSGAKRSYRGAVWLWEGGIPTIRPVVFSALGRGFSQVSYFVYEAVEGGEKLSVLIKDLEADDPQKRILLGQMAKITRQVHDAGYRHTDIVGHNFLVIPEDDQTPKMYLIDTDKTQKPYFTSKIPFLKLFFDMRCLRRLRIDNDSIRHFLQVYHGRDLKTSDLRIFAFWVSGGFKPRTRADLKKRLPERLRKIHREGN